MLAQQGFEVLRGKRFAKIKTLHLVATAARQQIGGLPRLDAFGDHAELERMADLDDLLHQHGDVGTGRQVLNKSPVDLELVEGQ